MLGNEGIEIPNEGISVDEKAKKRVRRKSGHLIRPSISLLTPLGLPFTLKALLVPILLKPLPAHTTNPATREMHEQVAVAVAHVVAALNVCVELALRVDTHVVPH